MSNAKQSMAARLEYLVKDINKRKSELSTWYIEHVMAADNHEMSYDDALIYKGMQDKLAERLSEFKHASEVMNTFTYDINGNWNAY
jgi:hypothetical protein